MAKRWLSYFLFRGPVAFVMLRYPWWGRLMEGVVRTWNRCLIYAAMGASLPQAFALTTRAFETSKDHLSLFNSVFAVLGVLAGFCIAYASVINEAGYEAHRARVVAAGERLAFAALLVGFASALRYACGHLLATSTADRLPVSWWVSYIVSACVFPLALINAYIAVWQLVGTLTTRTEDYQLFLQRYDTPTQRSAAWDRWRHDSRRSLAAERRLRRLKRRNKALSEFFARFEALGEPKDPEAIRRIAAEFVRKYPELRPKLAKLLELAEGEQRLAEARGQLADAQEELAELQRENAELRRLSAALKGLKAEIVSLGDSPDPRTVRRLAEACVRDHPALRPNLEPLLSLPESPQE